MKRRLYLIAALALINIVIMKYNEINNDKKMSTKIETENGVKTDSLSRLLKR